MRPSADSRPNTHEPRGALLTSNQESPTTLPGTASTNRGVPGFVSLARPIPLFSSLVRIRAASFPPDPQYANASPHAWVAANVLARPAASPSQDIDRRDHQAVQVSVGASPSSSPDDVAGLCCPRATTSLLLMTEGIERPERETCPMCKLKISFSLGTNSRIYACCM